MRNGIQGDEMKVPLVQIPDDSLHGGCMYKMMLVSTHAGRCVHSTHIPLTEESEMLHTFEQDWEQGEGSRTRTPVTTTFSDGNGMNRGASTTPAAAYVAHQHDTAHHRSL